MAAITALPAAGPLTGAETLPMVQGGQTVRVALAPLTEALGQEAAHWAAISADLLASASAQTGGYDPAVEFLPGTNGGIGLARLGDMFTDLAGLNPVAAFGEKLAKWQVRIGNHSYDLTQPDVAKRPIYTSHLGLPCVEFPLGTGMGTPATLVQPGTSFLLLAGMIDGPDGQAGIAYRKNTGTFHDIALDSFRRMRGEVFAAASDLPGGRPWKIASSADFSVPPRAHAVFHSLSKDGQVDARMNLGLNKAGNSPQPATGWTDADDVAGSTFGLGVAYQSLGVGVPATNLIMRIFGWAALDREPTDRDAFVRHFMDLCTPRQRAGDRNTGWYSDSTGDNVGSAVPDAVKEMLIRKIEDHLIPANPDTDYIVTEWARLADCRAGHQLLTDGTKPKRHYFHCFSAAGSQPSYFLGDRSTYSLDLLPPIDEWEINHDHNMAVTTAAEQNHPQAGLLRLGEWIEQQDEFRRRWPAAPHLMTKAWPIRTPGDLRVQPPIASQNLMQSDIYQDLYFADLNAAFEARGRDPVLYENDLTHPTTGIGDTGATLSGDVLAAAYLAWPRPARVTGPAIRRRRIAQSENIITNGLMENWAGGLPVGFTLHGTATVAPSIDFQERGPAALITSTGLGTCWLEWFGDATPFQGQVLVFSVRQFLPRLVGGASTLPATSLDAGQLRCWSDGTGAVSPSNWFTSTSGKPVDAWRWAHIHLPVPANATWFRLAIHGGMNGSVGGPSARCAIDRIAATPGLIPRDVLL